MEPPDIAHETRHSLKSMESRMISTITGQGERVVLEYIALAREYHPELFTEQAGSASDERSMRIRTDVLNETSCISPSVV